MGDPKQSIYRFRRADVYGRLLQSGGITGARRLRCGLLFTADGSVHWIVR